MITAIVRGEAPGAEHAWFDLRSDGTMTGRTPCASYTDTWTTGDDGQHLQIPARVHPGCGDAPVEILGDSAISTSPAPPTLAPDVYFLGSDVNYGATRLDTMTIPETLDGTAWRFEGGDGPVTSFEGEVVLTDNCASGVYRFDPATGELVITPITDNGGDDTCLTADEVRQSLDSTGSENVTVEADAATAMQVRDDELGGPPALLLYDGDTLRSAASVEP